MNPPMCSDCEQFMNEIGETGKTNSDGKTYARPFKLYQCSKCKIVVIQ